MTDQNNRTSGIFGKTVRILAGFAGAAALALAATSAFGRPGGHRGGPEFMLWKIDRMLEHVEASEDQRAAIEAITESTIADLAELRAGKAGIRDDFVAVLTAEAIDRERLEALRAELSETKEQASRRLTDAIGDIAEVLDRDQRLAISEKMAERFGRRDRW